MPEVIRRNVLQFNKTIAKWLSRIILKTSNRETKSAYRDLEKNYKKLARELSHLNYNETCINNDILPKYTKNRLSSKFFYSFLTIMTLAINFFEYLNTY